MNRAPQNLAIPDAVALLASIQSPEAFGTILRAVAQRFQDDAANLQSAWQDQHAGAVWRALASEFDRCADRCDRAVAKVFV